jgi:hypothetical protein
MITKAGRLALATGAVLSLAACDKEPSASEPTAARAVTPVKPNQP